MHPFYFFTPLDGFGIKPKEIEFLGQLSKHSPQEVQSGIIFSPITKGLIVGQGALVKQMEQSLQVEWSIRILPGEIFSTNHVNRPIGQTI